MKIQFLPHQGFLDFVANEIPTDFNLDPIRGPLDFKFTLSNSTITANTPGAKLWLQMNLPAGVTILEA